MKKLYFLIFFLVVGAALADGAGDAERGQSLCVEMHEIYKKTNGEFGWPVEACQ